ncbi:hypothetical protein MN033_04315 [Bacillus nitratireducens]|uniref:hypothetical protein n=2 Tax=Bacillus TaxID=1386 RepID=UPI00100814E9|nr:MULTISPECIES: hypothetical protein [Bacillus cereus group]UNP77426.1 hypothetical protein MN033_04315 [Bacillus nitratireducens]
MTVKVSVIMLHSSGIHGEVFSTSSKFTVYFLQKLLYNDYRSYLLKVIVVAYMNCDFLLCYKTSYREKLRKLEI